MYYYCRPVWCFDVSLDGESTYLLWDRVCVSKLGDWLPVIVYIVERYKANIFDD